MSSQLIYGVAYAARAELAEVCEVFPNLRRVHVELVGEGLRRDGLNARGGQKVQAAQVDAQAARRQLRNFLRLHPSTFSEERTGPKYSAREAATGRHTRTARRRRPSCS